MQNRRQFIGSAVLGAAAGIIPAALRADPPGAPAAANPERGTIIDFHNHWISPREIDLLKHSSAPPLRPYAPAWFDVSARLRHLDEVGVRRQVVSWVGSSHDGVLPPEEARPLWRAHNDDLAELVRKYPDRFSGLASLPTARPQWAAEELDRAHRDLGLIGATLPLDAFVSLEGARSLAPVFAAAQRHGSIIYIHRGAAGREVPGQHPEVGATNAYFGLAESHAPNQPVRGIPGDDPSARAALITTTHLATGVITFALTDFLDPYPDVTLQFTMLGGSIAFVSEQIGLAAQRARLPDPHARLRRIYLDTGPYSRSLRAVALAAKVWGADRILFGSDFGPQPSIAPMIAGIAQSDLSASDRHLIFVENARRLLAARGVV